MCSSVQCVLFQGGEHVHYALCHLISNHPIYLFNFIFFFSSFCFHCCCQFIIIVFGQCPTVPSFGSGGFFFLSCFQFFRRVNNFSNLMRTSMFTLNQQKSFLHFIADAISFKSYIKHIRDWKQTVGCHTCTFSGLRNIEDFFLLRLSDKTHWIPHLIYISR